jgi:hypothetical protein
MEHALELELAHPGFEAIGVLLDVGGGRFIVFALGEIEDLDGVGDRLGGAVDLVQLRGKLRAFAAQLPRLVGILPDGGIFELAGYLFEAFLLGVVLKETP